MVSTYDRCAAFLSVSWNPVICRIMLITIGYMAINAGPTDDLILLPLDHQAMLAPTILSTTSAPTLAPVEEIFNSNSMGSSIDLDGYHHHREPEQSSRSWSEIITGAPLLPISGEPVICGTFNLITLSSSCRTVG